MIKIMRYFFSIRGVLDEHNAREIGKVATNAFMFLWMYTGIANAVFLLLPQAIKTGSMINGVGLYVTHKVSELKLNYQEVSTKEYLKAVHKAVIHGAWFGISYGLVTYLMFAQFNGFFSIVSIGFAIFIVLISWTSDTHREIAHIVKVE
ncbi:DUF3278 domain-containing protein [Lentilactobacillus buchneri]|nr:DUF3278 domain-containing protein [Lentilactobacillus sp. Egmn17]